MEFHGVVPMHLTSQFDLSTNRGTSVLSKLIHQQIYNFKLTYVSQCSNFGSQERVDSMFK